MKITRLARSLYVDELSYNVNIFATDTLYPKTTNVEIMAKVKFYRVQCGNLGHEDIWATCEKSAKSAVIMEWIEQGYDLNCDITVREIASYNY